MLSEEPRGLTNRQHWLYEFFPCFFDVTRAFSTHSKILVVGLNGPVIGLPAALVAFADFICCSSSTYLLVPFSRLGIISEGGATYALVNRLGTSNANEALLMSKPIKSSKLKECGFVNDILEAPLSDDRLFRSKVLDIVSKSLGDATYGDSLLGIKKLIRRPTSDYMDSQITKELFATLESFSGGKPQKEFRKLMTGNLRHRL